MYKSTMSRALGSRRKDTGSGYTEYKLLARLLAFPAPNTMICSMKFCYSEAAGLDIRSGSPVTAQLKAP